jgi:hypothetical protein
MALVASFSQARVVNGDCRFGNSPVAAAVAGWSVPVVWVNHNNNGEWRQVWAVVEVAGFYHLLLVPDTLSLDDHLERSE